MSAWLSVIGIGEDGLAGLTPVARALVESAEIVFGGERHLAMLPPAPQRRCGWARPLAETMRAIAREQGRRVVVLASGDPLHYGVGVTLLRHFGRDAMIVLPQPSAFSLAAARMGWPLAECTMLTLHGRPLERLALFLAPEARLLVLSEDGGTPGEVARYLTARGWGESELTALARMGGADEARHAATAANWRAERVADLNTLAIRCVAGPEARPRARTPGMSDDAFRHDGQLTKRVVRAASLAALAPLPRELLWDVGAGCGSIAIEWLRAAGGRAIAIERDPARAALVAENAALLGVPDLAVVVDAAPAALHALPPPDAVFVGGGIAAPGLLETAWQALKPGGRLVANTVTLAGERRVLAFQQQHGGRLCRIAVAEAEALGGQQAWRSQLPVLQLSLAKSAR